VILRPATFQDAALLLAWRNDPETRAASHNTSELMKDEHLAWLKNTLNDASKKLFIAEENGLPVGTVRADREDGIHELSWTVAPNERGHGIGKEMLLMMIRELAEPVRAEIKVWNKAAIRMAEHAGMKYEREENGVLHYVKWES